MRLHLFCCASSVMSCIYPPAHSHLSPYPVALPVCHAPRLIVASPAPVAYSNPLSVFLGSSRLVHYPLSHPSAALSYPGHPQFFLPRAYSKARLCCAFAIHHQLSYSRSSYPGAFHDFSYKFLLSRCSLLSVTRDLDRSAHQATRQPFLVFILSRRCQSQFLLSREPQHVYPESIPTLETLLGYPLLSHITMGVRFPSHRLVSRWSTTPSISGQGTRIVEMIVIV